MIITLSITTDAQLLNYLLEVVMMLFTAKINSVGMLESGIQAF